MRHLYTAVLYLCLPLIALHLLSRGIKNKSYRARWRQRFGFSKFNSERPIIWVHAVSVGETQAAIPLISQLKNQHPDHRILITTTTPTGSAQVLKTFGDTVEHVYLPYDYPGSIKRFLRKFTPDILIVIETELWPNLFHCCHRNGVPILVANARLSAKSLRGYQRVNRLIKATLDDASVIASQNKQDGERFIKLGLNRAKLSVTGNMKYDLTLPNALETLTGKFVSQPTLSNRPIWIAASTHEGEDQLIIDAHLQVLQRLPNALLILVPRHPERFEAVTNLSIKQGLNTTTRSSNPFGTESMQVFVGDTMGELMVFYSAAAIAFVGGSLVPTGGHNLLEPLSLGKPVLFGPHMFNFEVLKNDVLDAQAGVEVQHSTQLAETVISLLTQPETAAKMGQEGINLIKKNRGATGRVAELASGLMTQT